MLKDFSNQVHWLPPRMLLPFVLDKERGGAGAEARLHPKCLELSSPCCHSLAISFMSKRKLGTGVSRFVYDKGLADLNAYVILVQCGGIGYSGSTVCAGGWYCQEWNPYYVSGEFSIEVAADTSHQSQCIPPPFTSTSQ